MVWWFGGLAVSLYMYVLKLSNFVPKYLDNRIDSYFNIPSCEGI